MRKTLWCYCVWQLHVYINHPKDSQAFISSDWNPGPNHELTLKYQVQPLGHDRTWVRYIWIALYLSGIFYSLKSTLFRRYLYYKSALECPNIYKVCLWIGTWMPYYFYHKSPIWNLNAIIDWKWAQLLLGGIIVEKLKNPLWGIFYYFNTRVPTTN